MTGTTITKRWIDGGAWLSPERDRRYLLWRLLPDTIEEDRGVVAFVMLNPSTADDRSDDPTLTKCLGYAERWHYRRLIVVNLFTLIDSDPNRIDFEKCETAASFELNHALHVQALRSQLVVAAWGAQPDAWEQSERFAIKANFRATRLQCLGKTANGSPRHPGRISYSTKLVDWP